MDAALYKMLVRLGAAYPSIFGTRRGHWRLVRFLKRFAPENFSPGIVRRRSKLWHLSDLKNNSESAIFYGSSKDEAVASAIAARVKDGDRVIDIGANIGYFTSMLSELVGSQGRVYAFEASSIHVASLQRNIELQELRNVAVFSTALADTKRCSVHYTTRSSGSLASDFADLGMECLRTSTVNCVPLDSVLPVSEERISFVKLDVDGNELEILQGGERLFAAHRPDIIVEVSRVTQQRAGSSVELLLRWLEEHRYSFRDPITLTSLSNEQIVARTEADIGACDVLCTGRD